MYATENLRKKWKKKEKKRRRRVEGLKKGSDVPSPHINANMEEPQMRLTVNTTQTRCRRRVVRAYSLQEDFSTIESTRYAHGNETLKIKPLS